MVKKTAVKVLATKMCVSSSCQDLEDARVDREDGHIVCTTTTVEDKDVLRLARRLLCLLVEPIGDRGRGRLVDDANNIKSSDAAGVLGSRTLRVREVCRDGNDCLCDLLAEIILCNGLHFSKNHRGNLFWGHNFVLQLLG